MRDKLVSFTRIGLFLAVAVFFLVLAFREVSAGELISGLKSANYFWVLISLVFATLGFVSRTYRWALLIEPIGYKPSVKNTFYALMTGYLANFILPRLGEITRCSSLNRTDGIPVASLMGTVVTERISDLVVLIILCIYVFFVNIELFGNFLYINIILPFYLKLSSWLDFSLLIYILIFLSVLLMFLFYRIIVLWLRKFKYFRKIENISGSIVKGMKSIFYMKKPLHFLAHTIFIWLMYYLMTWAVFMALPTTTELGSTAVLFILVIGGLGMSAPVQGGIGAYHWIVSMGLGLYGISREDGLVFATLSHESQALLMIILGSVSLFIIFRVKNKSAGEIFPVINKNITPAENK